MEATEVDPLARILVSSWLATALYSHQFREEYDSPPTTIAKAHHFRSVVQARVNQGERYALHPEFMEFGRVQVTDTSLGANYLIRSMSAVSIEENFAKRDQIGLFEVSRAFGISLLPYRFERTGMQLWVCGTKQARDSRRLIPAGELNHVGFWTYDDNLDPGPGGPVFDQGDLDPWDELGDEPDIDGFAL